MLDRETPGKRKKASGYLKWNETPIIYKIEFINIEYIYMLLSIYFLDFTTNPTAITTATTETAAINAPSPYPHANALGSSESCLILKSNGDGGNVAIEMEFHNNIFNKTEYKEFGKQKIDDHETWLHCFPIFMHLSFFVIQNKDGGDWVGDVSMTHSNPQYKSFIHCKTNCDCQCNGLSKNQYQDGCNGTCQEQQVINLGIDTDDTVDGDTKCRFGKACQFKVNTNFTGKN